MQIGLSCRGGLARGWLRASTPGYRGRAGWRIRGTYFESCNCDAICPCRRIDGVAGGRSTHGVCMGVLSWQIEEGAANRTVLSGLPVAMATRYSDDEPGSPRTWVLYLDAAASHRQREALEAIFTGRLAETPSPISRGRGRTARSSRSAPWRSTSSSKDPRSHPRADPGSLRGRGDSDVRDPRARPSRRGASRGRASG